MFVAGNSDVCCQPFLLNAIIKTYTVIFIGHAKLPQCLGKEGRIGGQMCIYGLHIDHTTGKNITIPM